MLSFQNNSNVISLEKGDFKLFIGSSNNKFSYTVQESLNILQSVLVLRSRDFSKAANMKEATQNIMNQDWRKKISESDQN